MESGIEVVLFDFVGVVVPMAGVEGMLPLAMKLGLDPASLHDVLYGGDLWRDVSTGTLSVEGFWEAVAAATSRERALLQVILSDVWEAPGADPAVIALVEALRPNVRVAILSNATTGLEDHLRRLGIDHLFDPVINSARVGLRKPDEAVFRHTLDVLGVPPRAVLFVDDKSRNTQVAEEMGIRSIVFQDARCLEAELTRLGLIGEPSRPTHAV